MIPTPTFFICLLLLPLTVAITYYDVRYRRIPNKIVLATLIGGLSLNIISRQLDGALLSLEGCALGFFFMFMLHLFGAMGAGDVKLFAAIGSVIGVHFVVQTFLIIVLTGGLLAVVSMFRAGSVRATLLNVLQIFVGFLPGFQMPKFAVPADRRHTIPYGVAITFGSLISLVFIHS